MENGELFFIENIQQDLEGKILWAADSFKRKYGQAPTLCLVHPSLLRARKNIGRVRLEPKKSILPNYLWIGVSGDIAAKPLAR